MDKDKMEQLWPTVVVSMAKMSNEELLNQVEIDACSNFLSEVNSLVHFMNEYLPKQIYGRSFRKEGDKYILDEAGEYRSMRGMWGAVWYVKKDYKYEAGGGKFIGPFGG